MILDFMYFMTNACTTMKFIDNSDIDYYKNKYKEK